MKNYIPLKVEFCLYENILCGKILQQDERLKKYTDNEDILISNCERYKIKIVDSPELRSNILYIRGKHTPTNHYTFHYEYETKGYAKEALNNFKELINTLNNYYKGDQEQKNTYFVEVCE